jgi:FkbM family methyltransferase
MFRAKSNSYRSLVTKFSGQSNVSFSEFALGRSPGKARFYELPMAGNGSLLEPDTQKWALATGMTEKNASSFEVTVSTLDREAARLPAVDLLWMDVQGAEAEVLAGGAEILKRTKSVFIEVALVASPYKGAALFHEIRSTLESQGFQCVGLGLDAGNGSGNAFFVRDVEKKNG